LAASIASLYAICGESSGSISGALLIDLPPVCPAARQYPFFQKILTAIPLQAKRRRTLTTYIVLINWTERGIQEVKKSPQRLDAAKKLLKDMGGEIKSVYMTMGEFDLVVVCEASDDAVAARFSLQLGMLGNVRTRTLKAFPETAYREIIASLG